MYKSIITHNDFDGVVSAAICSYIYKIDNIKFAGPNTIARAEIPIMPDDIVCDLPFPLECGLWFDHHEGNLQELEYRNIDLTTIKGKFELKPSCARVIYDYFKPEHQLPSYFDNLVTETDIIDAFDYKSIEDWRKETPGKIIDASIKTNFDSFRDKIKYLKKLVLWLREKPVEEVALLPEVTEKYQEFKEQEKEMLRLIEQSSSFLSDDVNQELIILDLTPYKQRPQVLKNLAYLLFPDSLAVIEIHNLFNRGIKSNNLSISMSLSLNLNAREHHKDIGEIMRELNIGDGHAGAAAGTVYCSSKDEMLKQKKFMIHQILKIWRNQN